MSSIDFTRPVPALRLADAAAVSKEVLVLVALECQYLEEHFGRPLQIVSVSVTPAERAAGDEEPAILRGAERLCIALGSASRARHEDYLHDDDDGELWLVHDKYGHDHYINVWREFGFARPSCTGSAA